MLLKSNGSYGATIGHGIVFTKQGAIDRYKLFLQVCYNKLDMASTTVLSDVQNDMVNIGFTWDEVENMEIEYLKGLN